MLLRTIVAIALLSALLEPAVRAAHAGAQTALHARALIVASDETELAVARARHELARWVAAGNDVTDTLPGRIAIAATCALRDGTACAVEAKGIVAWATPPPSRASPCPDDACAVYDQSNDDVIERRIEAAVTAQAREPDGTLLAERTTRIRFRTWREAPYAALNGREDSTFSPDFDDSGDDGGTTNGPGTLASTVYRNAVTGSTVPANVWHRRLAPAPTAPARWSP
jgi:hypothetical protein